MNLADERLKELDDPSLTADERALLRCRVAADLIHAGQNEAAREALGAFWRGVGERPDVEGLAESVAAEVLLQVGKLSGWIGASRQAKGAQEAAKDLISESITLFEAHGEAARVAIARADLALCYWREGAYDEARVFLTNALEGLTETVARAKTLLRLTTVEFSAGRYSDALSLLKEHAHIFDERVSHALRGSYHSHLAMVLMQLGGAEARADYLDRAIIEYTAAIYHYERAKHERYCARNLNNLAFLLHKIRRYGEAHEHLDRAQLIFTKLKDPGNLAQVDETRARVLIAEKKYREASRIIAGAVKTLEHGGASALLADALTVQGVARARLGVYESSINVLRRAADVAEGVGALANAGLALVALIEEHGATRRLLPAEVYEAYVRADGLLKGTQDAEDIARLRASARVVMRRLSTSRIHDKNFSLYGVLHELEGQLIGEALEKAGGSVTDAARLLGVRHQSLVTAINTRHKNLLAKRTPAKKRRRSIIKKDA